MKDNRNTVRLSPNFLQKLDKKGSVRVYLSRQMFLEPARSFGRPTLVYSSAGMGKVGYYAQKYYVKYEIKCIHKRMCAVVLKLSTQSATINTQLVCCSNAKLISQLKTFKNKNKAPFIALPGSRQADWQISFMIDGSPTKILYFFRNFNSARDSPNTHFPIRP